MDNKIKYENKNKTPNEVGITDEIGVDLIKDQLLSLYDERKAFEDGLDTAEKNLENFEKQWNIDKRLYELQMENWGLIEDKKTHKIHLIDEYWDLSKEQFYYGKVRPDTFQSEKMIESFNKEIETAKERLAGIADEIINIKKQLKDLNEDIPEDSHRDKDEVVKND